MEKNAVTSARESSSSSPPPQVSNLPDNNGFFSWILDERSKETPIRQARSIPWIGICALIASAITAFLSFALLKAVDGRPTWSNSGFGRFTQPSSWLSAFISANSIFLHVALSEGVTVAWWFRATRPDVTVRDLHKVWETGTSALSAAKEWRRLNYISLATLFVAIVPFNGFLLQGALYTHIWTHSSNVTISIPMVTQLAKGYSGNLIWNGTAINTASGNKWSTVFQQITNLDGNTFSKYAYFGNYFWGENGTINEKVYGNDTQAIWQATVPGFGFHATCLASRVPYNHSLALGAISRPIFGSSFGWNTSDPNTIFFNIYWKSTYTCTGEFEVRNCTLKAAVVEYPVQVQSNVSQAVVGPYYSLQPTTKRSDDKFIRLLPVFEDEGVFNTTYGGIARVYNTWYSGNISIEGANQTHGGNVTRVGGGFAPGLLVDYGEAYVTDSCAMSLRFGLDNMAYFQSFDSQYKVPDAESGWYYWPDTPIDLAEVILEQIRQSTFLASVYEGSQWWSDTYVPTPWKVFDAQGYTAGYWLPTNDPAHYIQDVNATRYHVLPTYGVRYYLWGASLAMTYLIILVVLPTFWGYWVLKRKPTMSPVDMARAFNAPVVASTEEHQQLRVDKLLQQVGTTPLHPIPEAR